jgi:transcriptional regulator of NAD metabolism
MMRADKENTTMQRITDREFRRTSIIVEDIHFLRCKFIECQIIYTAKDDVAFEDCNFVECSWTFDGPAEETLIFLSELYNGLGQQGRELVESVFESIRSGTVKHGTIPMVAMGLR